MTLLPRLAAAMALLCMASAGAQEPDFGAQRERIKAERAAVEARFSEEQKACRAKFAVTDCMRAVTRERNARLAELRLQENALADTQRRLREENTSFEAIKDDVRRDAALRYLSQPDIPLTRVAALLGYSEPSVLTRRCKVWFASSPRQIRERPADVLEMR